MQTTETAGPALAKSATGVAGLDEITGGGLPTGRTTLVCGGPGCGKTLLAMEFVVRGILDHDEPGVFMAFEEGPRQLAENSASLGFDLDRLVDEGRLLLDHVKLDAAELAEAGDYDLDGLLIRLDHAIKSIGAKRVALDTIEALFGPLQDSPNLRRELRRLLGWLGERGVTAVVTGERGEGTLTRRGLEEYVSDCVIALDHRVRDEVSTRRLRIVKYRGSSHESNEYPFMLDEHGFSVLPITSMRLDYPASTERVPTGVERLDAMLGGGPFAGSTVLISGESGSGKTILGSRIAEAACQRGERVLMLLLEESPAQLARNAGSVGINLEAPIEAGLLRCLAERPTSSGFESRLAHVVRELDEFDPSLVVCDPITALTGDRYEVEALVRRMIDVFKGRGITLVQTSLTHGRSLTQSETYVSSLIDTWIALSNLERGGERNRAIQIFKSRGSEHSNQMREFALGAEGIEILDVYTAGGEVLMGTARLERELEERSARGQRAEELELDELSGERRRAALEAQIAAIQAELDLESARLRAGAAAAERRDSSDAELRSVVAASRSSEREAVGEADANGAKSR